MKKKLLKTICFLAIALTVLVPIKDQKAEAAKKTPQLNRTKVSMTAGEVLRLTVSHTKSKIQWSSKDKKVATVNSRGLLKARAKGSTYIYARIGSRKLPCKVTVGDKEEKAVYWNELKKSKAGTLVPARQIDYSNEKKYFTISKIDNVTYKRMKGKSYTKNKNIKLADLRYLKVLNYNYKHKIQVGELIVNKKIAKDINTIFQKLFDEEYEIASMRLIDDFWKKDGASSDDASVKKNNTSAFCYRKIAGSKNLSNHAMGMAIDINPKQNPYVSTRKGKPYVKDKQSRPYIKRSPKKAHVITKSDYCYKLFKKYGFTWGGDWRSIKDYQHFEKKEKRK